jgi:hypothetical protein
MTIWMSDDARHIPIKMMAKIKFGRIFVHLTAYSSDTPVVASTTPPITAGNNGKQL